MANKKKEDAKAPETDNTDDPIALEPVLLTVTAEHVATPHGIELRRKGGEFVVDARTQDFASTETVGATTVENVLRNAGANLPDGEEQLVISFSPHNGEVIAVLPKPPAPAAG